jgi:uncharacterized protein (DUF362 family)
MACPKAISRRSFVGQASLGLATSALMASSIEPPTAPVAIARCRRYEFEAISSTLGTMFDQIGGIGALARGKTVTVKVNVTGGWHVPVYTLSPLETVYTHPVVALAVCRLLYEQGAHRIIICESLYDRGDARSGFQRSGFDVSLFESLVPVLEWENTRNLGTGSSYREVTVPSGAFVYRYFMVNHRYVDTDVMVSIPKMKNHQIAGVTLAMKNLFGITPSALYSSAQPNEDSTEARMAVLHEGTLSPAGGEIQPVPSLLPGFRVPRVVVDIVSARPIDLSIIDGIVSMHGGEGAWSGTAVGVVTPGLLVVGRNSVCTDSVATALMGYDPRAPEGSKPFYNGANSLELAASRGLGTNRLEAIDVRGLSIKQARYSFLPAAKE